MAQRQAIAVYCGSRFGSHPAYRAAAETVGRVAAERGIRLIYGGGKLGLMGAVADAALKAGGEVVGVIPETLVEREHAHRALTELHVVGSMHERKAKMAALADAFVVLPGGIGTLDELAEAMTWNQLGLINDPIGLVDVGGFYQPLVHWLMTGVEAGFVPRPTVEQLIVSNDAEAVITGVLEAARRS